MRADLRGTLVGMAILTFTGLFTTDWLSALGAEARGRQTSAAIAESPEALESQIEAILSAARGHDSKLYENLIADLRIPEGTDWFSATFGEEEGAKVAAAYGRSWAAYKEQIARIFRDAGKARPKRAIVRQFSTASSSQDGFLQAVLNDVRTSATFYTAGAGKDRDATTLPGVYVFVQGSFRIVNWNAFYGLPNVRSPRIRVGTSVAMSQLLHQVNPSMTDDIRKQHIQGGVVLRIVIDRDGNVAQVQPVSGPEPLVTSAMDAVRQWRFRPTLLNGDPVEVDSTVDIEFSRDQ